MRSTDVAYRLKKDLKSRRIVRLADLLPFTERYNVSHITQANGHKLHIWTEEQYRRLLNEFEE